MGGGMDAPPSRATSRAATPVTAAPSTKVLPNVTLTPNVTNQRGATIYQHRSERKRLCCLSDFPCAHLLCVRPHRED